MDVTVYSGLTEEVTHKCVTDTCTHIYYIGQGNGIRSGSRIQRAIRIPAPKSYDRPQFIGKQRIADRHWNSGRHDSRHTHRHTRTQTPADKARQVAGRRSFIA